MKSLPSEATLRGRRGFTARGRLGVSDVITARDTGIEAFSESERLLKRRRSLPGGRSVTGGFLIALAAVATFASYTSAAARPRQLYVVATHFLAAGTRITAGDLRLAALDLPDPAVRRQVFSSTSALQGASVLAPIAPGALVEASAVVGRGGSSGTREVSMTLDRTRAVGGTIKPGEFVDVLGTFGTGADAYTVAIAAHVQVIGISNLNSSLGDTRSQLITFATPSELTAEAIANAAIAAQVTLVRSAEVSDPRTSVAPDPGYRPPSGPPTRGGG